MGARVPPPPLARWVRHQNGPWRAGQTTGARFAFVWLSLFVLPCTEHTHATRRPAGRPPVGFFSTRLSRPCGTSWLAATLESLTACVSHTYSPVLDDVTRNSINNVIRRVGWRRCVFGTDQGRSQALAWGGLQTPSTKLNVSLPPIGVRQL